ncbi:type II toxin-antitoxin system VapB family antitoxin [Microvirga sp. VF16]|uniref:type II toxin-antitoxin system VapB family antitoxin n=1 Tax=Microvirga sp. VF16 TaxID=2807101 RepID=UPI00193E2760|nr:type II toxin-antitoxin system VapB family antitoxin [Microvirga sp. VF16]QRM32773.1 type II toxin-antitoxin system VapB family antitoxin [Microvirga sp. VF16]
MALNIKDPELLSQIEHLARVRRVKKMDVIRDALNGAMEKENSRKSVRELLAPVLDKAARLGTSSTMTWEEHKRASDEEWGEE